MQPIAELMDRAVGDVPVRFRLEEVELRARRVGRRRRTNRLLALASAAVVLVVVASFAIPRLKDRDVVTDVTGGVFPRDTGVTLVFADGLDGAVLVDLDRRVAVRRPLQGGIAGEPTFKVTRAGDALIVQQSSGFGNDLPAVYAMPLDGGPRRLIGHATVTFPATESNHLWLVQYRDHVTRGVPTLREVDLDGRVVREGRGLDSQRGIPAIGVPDGVAHGSSGEGVLIWDANTGRVTARLGSGPGFVADAHGDLLTWCERDCEQLHISRLGGRDLVVPAPTEAPSFDGYASQFSPGGRYVAAIVGDRGPVDRESRWNVLLIDTTTGTARQVFSRVRGTGLYVTWGPDAKQLFVSTYSYRETETTIGVYNLRTSEGMTATVPVGGALSPIAIERDAVRALMSAELGSPDACPAYTSTPSERTTNACGFAF